jgi:hypothetical protein
MDWVKGFFIPLIEIVFIGGIAGTVLFVIGKAIYNGWSKSFKFFWKYKIRGNAYPESYVKWVLDCIDKGIGFYDAKKMLFVKMMPKNQIWETLYIYDEILNTMGLPNRKTEVKHDNKELPTM